MPNAQPQEKPYYTYADFLEWDEGTHAEIIDGELYMMAPPSTFHQFMRMELAAQLHAFLKGKPCGVYAAPFGVRLFPRPDRQDATVVEPDIVVVCDRSKLDERGCNGAPDMVIEILSPSTARTDKVVKFHTYLAAGVKEYWIVNPDEKIIQVHILENGHYTVDMYDETGKVPVMVLPGCIIDVSVIFGGFGHGI
ncbi:MAG: Uma2 family endonuclease [Treponema sp.]|jgi:Uma2 family endonuclease|nr:Uma2 family endonuclease [Treponema sp.]